MRRRNERAGVAGGEGDSVCPLALLSSASFAPRTVWPKPHLPPPRHVPNTHRLGQQIRLEAAVYACHRQFEGARREQEAHQDHGAERRHHPRLERVRPASPPSPRHLSSACHPFPRRTAQRPVADLLVTCGQAHLRCAHGQDGTLLARLFRCPAPPLMPRFVPLLFRLTVQASSDHRRDDRAQARRVRTHKKGVYVQVCPLPSPFRSVFLRRPAGTCAPLSLHSPPRR